MTARKLCNSGFTSKRINLSPFTKDFRGVEHFNESLTLSGAVSQDMVIKPVDHNESYKIQCSSIFFG